MSKMNELYAKVAADSALQEKYYKIVEEAGDEAALGEKLVAFAKEQGFDITISDVEEFFKSLAEPANGQLSEEELDSVAGGKGIGYGGGLPNLSALVRGGCTGGGGGNTSVITFYNPCIRR
ncbi:MAG: Nif11-like leader peptide family RiPP precursor [Bacillota bacterium]